MLKPDITLQNNPDFRGMASIQPDIPFFCEGQQQLLTLVSPNHQPGEAGHKDPLIVFLQGSAWTSPNRYYQLPQLCRYAQRGIAVAAITHRDCTRGNPFPSYLKDAKAAIRFLRSQAGELGIDPERVGFFGTSSGGNTALLVGLTGDDPRYRTGDYQEQSDAVRAVADCFGPTDLLSMKGGETEEDSDIMRIMNGLIGGRDAVSVLRAMSPVYEVKKGGKYPAFLIAHGNRDEMVPFVQSERMHKRLLEAGANSRLILVLGAEHEGTFWSEELHALILDHFIAHL